MEQLQYINWSYYDDQGSSTRDVTDSGSMYKYYPYLQYSRVTWGYQSKEDAIAGDSTGGAVPSARGSRAMTSTARAWRIPRMPP